MKLNLEQINKKKEEIVESITKRIMSIEYNEMELAFAELAINSAKLIAKSMGLEEKNPTEQIKASTEIEDKIFSTIKTEILGMCIVKLEAEEKNKEDQVGEA